MLEVKKILLAWYYKLLSNLISWFPTSGRPLVKPNIHPKYRPVLFHDTSVDQYYIIGSTADTEEEKEYKGKTYPYISLDISSASHPFYTGKQRTSERAGRVAQFKKRFKSRRA